MKITRWFLSIGVLLLVIVTIWYIFAVRRNNDSDLRPHLSVATLSISDIGEHKIAMNSKVIMSNPLPIELKTKRLNYTLLINGNKVMESSYDKPIVVKSNDSSTMEMPMDIEIKPLVKVLKDLEDQKADSADYTLLADVQLDLPIKGETNFDLKETKRLPAFRIPKVSLKDIDLDKLKFKESKIRVDLVVENRNVFPIRISDLDYNVTLGDEFVMNGQIDGYTTIPAKSSEKIPVELEVQNKSMLKMITKTLFEDETTFKIDMTCGLESKNELLDGSKIAMHTTGTLKEVKQAIRNAKEGAKASEVLAKK